MAEKSPVNPSSAMGSSLVIFAGFLSLLVALTLFIFLIEHRPKPSFTFPIIFSPVFNHEAHLSRVPHHILSSIQRIEAHNADPDKTFFMKFSDISALSPAEYQQRLGFQMEPMNGNAKVIEKSANFTAPDSINWRDQGKVNRVKNQGPCGSCWAFASIGALESQHAIHRGGQLDLSEQNLVDCSRDFNKGCHGGIMSKAYEYIGGNGGVDTEEAYPYEARDGACRFRRDKVGESLQAYGIVREGDENALKEVVAEKGPVAVAIDAGQPSFQHYGGGVYYDAGCNPGRLNHAVLVVGYGRDDRGGDYWFIKNSWGTGWGEGGYIKMARNRNNHCGVAQIGTIPFL